MPRCLVALGGNVGAVEQTFDGALERLDAVPEVTVCRVSRVYRTRPVGERAGGAFRNAVAELETELSPLGLLDRMQEVESALGRTREIRWGPRTLDLDLILYGDEVIEHPRLRVPHPACWYRRFVLDPLVELADEVVHPEKRVTFGELRERLLDRPLRIAIAGADRPTRSSVIDDLRAEFREVEVTDWESAESPNLEPAVLIWLGEAVGAEATSNFDGLPQVPRLDASHASGDRKEFVRHVTKSALGGETEQNGKNG